MTEESTVCTEKVEEKVTHKAVKRVKSFSLNKRGNSVKITDGRIYFNSFINDLKPVFIRSLGV